MNRLPAALALCSFALFLTPAGSAAAVFPATGTVSIATFAQHMPPVTLTGSGFASSTGGPGSAHSLPAGFFALTTPLTIGIFPTFVGVDRLSLPDLTHAAGVFAPNGGMALNGSILFFGPFGGGGAAGQVPLSPIGGGGGGVPSSVQHGPLLGSLSGATWMGAGGPTPVVFSMMDDVLNLSVTAVATAFDNRSVGGLGSVQLVAPAAIRFGIFGTTPAFATLTIAYTPEPTTLALAGAGFVGLAVVARRRLRRHSR